MSSAKVFKYHIDPKNADVVLLPLNWSLNNQQTKRNIQAVLAASNETETFHEFYGFQKNCKIGCDDDNSSIEAWLNTITKLIEDSDPKNQEDDLVFTDYDNAKSYIEEKIEFWLEKDKLPITLSGDNTLLFASLKAHAKFKSNFSLLHLSKSPNLIEPKPNQLAKQKNTLFKVGSEIPEITKIVGIGYQTINIKEYGLKKEHPERIIWHTYRKTQNSLFSGESFSSITKKWTNCLHEFVFLNIDLSVLESLNISELEYFIQQITESKRKYIGVEISGFDQLMNNHSVHEKVANLLLIIAKTFGRSRGKI